MTDIDHAAEAIATLEGAGDGRNFATDASVAAVAHAALALVEQQRIANLLAYLEHAEGDEYEPLRDDIRKGLGL